MSTIPDLIENHYWISTSFFLNELCIRYRPEEIKNLTWTDYLRLGATELGFITTTLIGVVETVFWTSLFLLAKAIHVFLPEFEITDRIFTQLGISTALTISATITAAMLIVKNFSIGYKEVESDIQKPLYNQTLIPFAEKYLMGAVNYRLFTSSPIMKPVKG